MYNRYIPQPDGSYRRNPTPEPQQEKPKRPTPPPAPVPSPPTNPNPCPPPKPEECPRRHGQKKAIQPPRKPQEQNQDSLTGFFKNLLPRNIDTADLMIILLLLLMAGDCEESKNNALLTLALYFFM